MKYRSIVTWPAGVIFGIPTTEDTHDTKEQAEVVCAQLVARGLGGEGLHFPISTEVKPINNEPLTADCYTAECDGKIRNMTGYGSVEIAAAMTGLWWHGKPVTLRQGDKSWGVQHGRILRCNSGGHQ